MLSSYVNLIDSHDTQDFYIYVRTIKKQHLGRLPTVIAGNAYDLLRMKYAMPGANDPTADEACTG